MKVNPEGLRLIDFLLAISEPAETKTNAEKAVKALVKRRLTSNQYSALVCFIMGVGIDAFKSSMLRKLNEMTLDGAIKATAAFDDYIYTEDDFGRRVADPALIQQRVLERSLFLTPEIVVKRKPHGRKKVNS